MFNLPDGTDNKEPIQEPADKGREPVDDQPRPEGEEAPGDPPNDLDDGPLVAANANLSEQL
ncbi:hypothetical protein HCU64_22575 [Methylobacterium sp. C25]|uniref:hypothetical protein n=1 Tax=Methylobacterium sp. C25 TaxID=2721622 RepID=UPI001F2BA694|nr:hypothetical protein [Methylobacterium sp. C25]MCE4226532.1 hypothetical protein [Methylobacterium sp. C25]